MTFHTLLDSDIYLFADDIKLSRTIKNSDDIQILQDDIHKLFEWSVTWNLNFSQSKCCYIDVFKLGLLLDPVIIAIC